MSSDNAKAAPGEWFDTAPCGYISIDAEGRIQTANPKLSDWLATPGSAIVGTHVTALFSIASRVVFETSVLPLLHLHGEVSGVSLDLSSRTGENIPVMISATARGTGQGRMTQMVLLRSERRRNFERDLLEARAETEARLSIAQKQGELREQFVAILGHDLRNPVAAFYAGIRALSRNPPKDKKAELLQLMQGSVHRMERLIENVLDYARERLGSGIELDLGVGDLEPAIRQAFEELRAVHPDRDLKLSLNIGHDVECDAQRIGQLVSNLLGNALTHGDTERPVTVDAVTFANNGLKINVCNHGPQISAETQKRLFDPFDRGDESNYRKGLGLGLHIASEIAKAHHGGMSIQSDEDVTCFTFQMSSGDAPGRD